MSAETETPGAADQGLAALGALLHKAETAYHAGGFDEAIRLQKEVIAIASPKGLAKPHYYMKLAMFLFEFGAFPESLDWLQQAGAIWPTDAEISENTGVLLTRLGRYEEARTALDCALALGSSSLNVLDALCHCAGRLNDDAATQRYGRRVLVAKNEAALAAGRRYRLPAQPPPPFDPTRKQENVISYSLWGSNPRYSIPLLENLKLRPHLFPSLSIRVYVDNSVPSGVINQLTAAGADIVDKSSESGSPFYTRLLWRFEVANARDVRRFLVRDADSLLTIKERIAIDQWLASDTYFHVMRDRYTHTDLILAGMWGGVAGVLPDITELWGSYRLSKMLGRTADQRFLGDMLWPTISQSCLIHDSVFTGCLDSVPFPPYGDLLPGHHIGQNAFIHFRPN